MAVEGKTPLKRMVLNFFSSHSLTTHDNWVNQLFYSLYQALDISGNGQRPVFSLSVSQPVHKITNL